MDEYKHQLDWMAAIFPAAIVKKKKNPDHTKPFYPICSLSPIHKNEKWHISDPNWPLNILDAVFFF